MTIETCDVCHKSGEADHDPGGLFDHVGLRSVIYVCAACVRKEIAAEDVQGDPYEEQLIKERGNKEEREARSWSDRHDEDEPL